ncbi:hypothetical protein [Streptomyces sp. NA02950]|uniref:hypothetical protein n=1 Tax=Streptomyces sp. NA02950 TaxID=2742137 RepID=UPI0020CAB602|nr:hypothetical protein [Streptomyces sp. NA02950]
MGGRPEVVAVTQEANARSRRLPEARGTRQDDAFTESDAPQVMYALHRDADGQPGQVPRT